MLCLTLDTCSHTPVLYPHHLAFHLLICTHLIHCFPPRSPGAKHSELLDLSWKTHRVVLFWRFLLSLTFVITLSLILSPLSANVFCMSFSVASPTAHSLCVSVSWALSQLSPPHTHGVTCRCLDIHFWYVSPLDTAGMAYPKPIWSPMCPDLQLLS